MKLDRFKAKYTAKLALHTPASAREKELADLLAVKLAALNEATAADLAFTLHQIYRHENVSAKFKELTREMLEDLANAIATK